MRGIISLLSLLPLITWFFSKERKKDLLSPTNIITALYLAQITIPTLSLANPDTINYISNRLIRESVSSTENYTIFILLSIISYYLVIIATKISLKTKTIKIGNNKEEKKLISRKRRIYRNIGIILWIIGLIATIITLQRIGGISYLMQNQNKRTTLLRDLDLLSWIRPCLSYGLILIAYSRKKELSIPFLLFIILTGLVQGMGTRRTMIMLTIEALFIYHYVIKKIEIKHFLKIKYIAIVCIIYVLFTFLLFLRSPNASNNLMQNIKKYNKNASTSIITTLANESYVKHHMLTIEYFKNNNYWHGKSFIGLITSIIPSSIYPQKPPVDDGTYLYSISQGRSDISPPMSFKQLNVSSLPLETFSSMYANFGIIGVLLGSLLKGSIIGYAYKKMKLKKRSLLAVYAYVILLFNFEVATLNIFQTVRSIVTIAIIIGIANIIVNKRTTGASNELSYDTVEK